MVAAPTKPCDSCNSSGRQPREQRRLEDGSVDWADKRPEELCYKCGGSGVIPYAAPTNLPEKTG